MQFIVAVKSRAVARITNGTASNKSFTHEQDSHGNSRWDSLQLVFHPTVSASYLYTNS